MDGFRDYLLSRRLTSAKGVDFYLHWVTRCYEYLRKEPGEAVSKEEMEKFLRSLSKSREEWQIDQAREAIKLFLFYEKRKSTRPARNSLDHRAQWKAVAVDMRHMLRLKHRAHQTERAYMSWIRQFYRFLKGKSPYALKDKDVKDFMTFLAVEKKVSASTQNQAFNAILFLFRHTLDENIDNIGEAVRAKKKKRLPVVLSQPEINRLFQHMEGDGLLMGRIFYGCGLRLPLMPSSA